MPFLVSSKVVLFLTALTFARAYDILPYSTNVIVKNVLEIDYVVYADFRYWGRYDTFYDAANENYWDIMIGINLAAFIKAAPVITLFSQYQYSPDIELALFDVTPKAQLVMTRPDMALLLPDLLPFDMNIMAWVEYSFLSFILMHQSNMMMSLTSIANWLQQLLSGGTVYIPFYLSDLQYYGNPTYYNDPFLTFDMSTLINAIVDVIPSFTNTQMIYSKWLFGGQNATLTPSGVTPCWGPVEC